MRKFLREISSGLTLLLAAMAARAQAPAWQQAVTMGGGVTIVASATDAAGNLYLAGRFTGVASVGAVQLTSAGGSDLFVAKWSRSTLTFAWAQRAGGTGDDYADALAVSGNTIYVAGSYQGTAAFGAATLSSAGADDGYVWKLTDAGNMASPGWVQGLGGAADDRATALAAVGSSVYVGGIFSSAQASLGSLTLTNSASSGAISDGFVARLTDAGATSTAAWARPVGGPNSDLLTGLAATGTSVYLAGLLGSPAVLGSTTVSGCFYARLTDGGGTSSYDWAINSGGFALPNAVVASGGSLYVAGRYQGTSTFGTTSLTNSGAGGSYDLFVAKLADAGTSANFAWALAGTGPLTDFANALAVRGNSVYVAGSFSSTASFGSFRLTSVGYSNDWVVARIIDGGSTAAYAWAQQAGGASYEQAATVALGNGGIVYVAGGADAGAFGSIPTGGGATLAWLTDPALPARAATSLPNLALYPNPARGTATVRVPAGAGPATLTLLDALSRVVRTAAAPAGQDYPLGLAGLAPGVYALRVQVGEGQAVQRLVVE